MKIAAVFLSLFIATPVGAFVTGEEYKTRLSEDHRVGFDSGAIEMAIYLATHTKQTARAQCIKQWWFSQDGKAQDQYVRWMASHPEFPPVIILGQLIKKNCGEN